MFLFVTGSICFENQHSKSYFLLGLNRDDWCWRKINRYLNHRTAVFPSSLSLSLSLTFLCTLSLFQPLSLSIYIYIYDVICNIETSHHKWNVYWRCYFIITELKKLLAVRELKKKEAYISPSSNKKNLKKDKLSWKRWNRFPCCLSFYHHKDKTTDFNFFPYNADPQTSLSMDSLFCKLIGCFRLQIPNSHSCFYFIYQLI